MDAATEESSDKLLIRLGKLFYVFKFLSGFVFDWDANILICDCLQYIIAVSYERLLISLLHLFLASNVLILVALKR